MKIPDSELEHLRQLVSAHSKHSNYQALHPLIRSLVGSDYEPRGRLEEERWRIMSGNTPFIGKRVLDIGANTGYFTIHALHSGAIAVRAVEGNGSHAAFIREAGRVLRYHDRLDVEDEYFNFDTVTAKHFDIAFCLNVLHHLGDDYGEGIDTRDIAKEGILRDLNALAEWSNAVWFQLGFNWKGDRTKPLFENGLKTEMMEFVLNGVRGSWSVAGVWIYDADRGEYLETSESLLTRRDEYGEFANRPLFLLTRT